MQWDVWDGAGRNGMGGAVLVRGWAGVRLCGQQGACQVRRVHTRCRGAPAAASAGAGHTACTARPGA